MNIRFLGTIRPGELDVSGDSGHNDYLVMPDLTNCAPRGLYIGARVRRLAATQQTGTVVGIRAVEGGHVYEVQLTNPTETIERSAACWELIEPEPAPRRRTEPAITVPPGPCDHGVNQDGLGGFVVGVDEHGDDTRCAYCRGKLFAFTFDETTAMRAHGAAAYACMAADCDQVRELLAVEEAKAAMEAWRLSNAEWLDHYTDSDSTGELHEEVWHDTEAERAHWERWLAGLTPPTEHEHMSDWAARQEPGPRGSQTKAYMQYLFDKLRAGALEASGRTEGP